VSVSGFIAENPSHFSVLVIILFNSWVSSLDFASHDDEDELDEDDEELALDFSVAYFMNGAGTYCT
jgi:hypothetical protein